MTRSFQVLEPAEIEIRQVVKEYDALRPGLGDNILTELDKRFEHIQEFPEAYQKTAHHFRSVELDSVPFKVYYVVSRLQIVVTGFVPSRSNPKKQLRMLKQRYFLSTQY